MSTDFLSAMQISFIIGFVILLFKLYKVLISQKNAQIALLKQELEIAKGKLAEAHSQSPDIISKALSERIDIAKAEIMRLKEDENAHREEIREKEIQLDRLNDQLDTLNALIEDTDLICPKCRAPLSTRTYQTISGHSGGREVEADIEYVEYECGLALSDGQEVSPCRYTATSR